MKTYLEINVPIKYEDDWFRETRNLFPQAPVRWQRDYYHVTMAFIDETPRNADLCPIIARHLETAHAPILTLDRLDAFSTNSGMHIIHLAADDVPRDFLELTEAIRSDLRDAGCVMNSGFMLHVTLGRLLSPDVRLPDLRKQLHRHPVPPLTLTLTDVDYREFRGRTLLEWKLNASNY